MIGIITSGTENYNLIKLCHTFNLPYCIIADTDCYPYQEKEIETLEKRINSLMKYGQELGCTHFLLSPIIELYYTHIVNTDNNTIPLFNKYINHCFQHSLIGKIGYIGGHTEELHINSIHHNLSNSYILTNQQNNIKNFQNPPSKWTKDTSMRTYLSRFIGNRTMMINKIIKFDLRYFKDANVDTIIPLSYEYFNFQRTISSFFNPKKQKFHKWNIIESCMEQCLQHKPIATSTQSEVNIFTTGSDHLLKYKKWETIASQGSKYKLVYKTINDI